MGNHFVTTRDRDAWAAIRGFAYQVDCTVLRWLELQEGQVLELERGEDVDLVTLLAPEFPEERLRVMEQIKHLDESITLRHHSVVESIVNFTEHSRANPDFDLFFRYSTTARLGRERPSPFPQGTPAIKVWGEIQSGQLTGEGLQTALQNLQSIVLSATRPGSIPSESWVRFREFIEACEPHDLEEVIRRFEIAANQEGVEGLGLQIVTRLIAQGTAENRADAAEQYGRLFLFVLRLLSAPGLKRLDVDEREHQLSTPVTSIEDSALLARLATELEDLTLRTQKNEAAILEVKSAVASLAKANSVDISVAYTRIAPSIDPPPAAGRLCHRTSTVEHLVDVVQHHTWTAINGGTGSGKSQLALQVANRIGTLAAWIHLDGLTDDESCLHLELCLAHASGYSKEARLESDAFIERLAGRLVILDGVPNLIACQQLRRRLRSILESAKEAGMHILSTSRFTLPSEIELSASPSTVSSLKVPAFTDNEAAELLLAHGAPPPAIRTTPFLNRLAHGHPLLLIAVATYLGTKGWTINEEQLDALLRGDFKERLDHEVFTRLAQTTVEEQDRELLYRLDLIIGAFTLEHVRCVASIEPVVSRPRERLSKLLGPWVQQGNDGQMRLSPLLSGTLQKEIPSATEKQAYLKLAENLLGQRSLNQYMAADLILYLHMAGETRRAGLALAMTLGAISSQEPDYAGHLLDYWTETPFPKELGADLRIYIRGLQIKLRDQASKSVDSLISDLHLLVVGASQDDAWALFGACVTALPTIAARDFSVAKSLVGKMTALLSNGRVPLPPGATVNADALPPEFQNGGWLVWFLAGHIKSAHEALDWLEILESLTPRQLSQAFEGDLASQGSKTLTSRVWILEADKPNEHRDWESVLVVLERIASFARSRSLDVLQACAEHGQVVVMSEYQNNLAGARRFASEALSQTGRTPEARFLINECLGRQFLYHGNTPEAIAVLQDALGYEIEDFALERIDAKLALARAYSYSQLRQAVAWIERAVLLAGSDEDTAGTPLIQALGELAISRWQSHNLLGAFEALDQGAEQLLAIRDDSELWRGLFMTFGHVTGYLVSIAETGEPPTGRLDGGEYTAPHIGFFAAHHSARSPLFRDELFPFIYAQMSTFAVAVGRTDRAARWTVEALDIARETNQSSLLAGLLREGITVLLDERRYAEMMELALAGAGVLAATAELRGQGRTEELASGSIDVEQVLGGRSSKGWIHAHQMATNAIAFPVLFHLVQTFIHDEALARQSAEIVAACLREMADGAESGFQELAEAIEFGFDSNVLGSSLTSRCVEGGIWFSKLNLRAIGYVLATLKPDIPLEQKAVLHIACMRHVEDVLVNAAYGPMAYRDIVAPFISSFWIASVKRSKFRFWTPALAEQELVGAQQLPAEARIRTSLRAVATSLNVRLSTEVTAWLKTVA